ncbi:MAG TPA: hypothetical protein VFH54_06175 [Mycobacteriales bacterium]|nr:hypothetical protein [Mycobacteriales bacterium]
MIALAIASLALSALMFGLGALTFYWVNVRPERARRRAFYDKAMPREIPGMPKEHSIFDRLDQVVECQAAQGRDIAAIQRALHIPAQRNRPRAVR